MYKVKHLEQVKKCCSTQWHGKLEDGRVFFVKFYEGLLTVDMSNNSTDLFIDYYLNGSEILNIKIGDKTSYSISEITLKEILTINNFKF